MVLSIRIGNLQFEWISVGTEVSIEWVEMTFWEAWDRSCQILALVRQSLGACSCLCIIRPWDVNIANRRLMISKMKWRHVRDWIVENDIVACHDLCTPCVWMKAIFYFECPRLIYLRGNQGNVTTAACGKFKCGVYLYDFNLDEYLIGPLWWHTRIVT